MARYSRSVRAARRRYVLIGLKNLGTSLKVSEALLKALEAYRKNLSGSVISAQSVGMAVGISIIEAVLPKTIEETKKLIVKKKRKLPK